MVEVHPTVASDALELSKVLRQSDERELRALGTALIDAVEVGLDNSHWVRSLRYNGELVCIFGLGPWEESPGTGIPWMFGSKRMNTCPKAILEESRRVISEMLDKYPRLVNIVDSRNTISIRYLKHLGFIFDDEPILIGEDRVPFHVFFQERLH